ncbi:QsdR family transcriptional regulator [Isoptericola sp. NPDC019482]|uniref:QsdR family transcriptional regulator n=1 Tax=Isoptericola sp. NPDC019482 TaxID=3154688 RepID=UPI003472E922
MPDSATSTSTDLHAELHADARDAAPDGGHHDAPVAAVGLEAAPTPLSLRLAPGAHADARRAFDLARETFIAGRRLDMGSLAASLGVDRTSVFRWVGNRDALLTEVLWSLAVPTLVQADRATASERGAARVADLLTRFAGDLITAPYFRDFLAKEPARALRLLTTKASPIQHRFLATCEWLVRTEIGDHPFDDGAGEGGEGDGGIDPASLAYLLVRVSESFTYADLITGEAPEADRAAVAFRHLLRVPPTPA